MPPNSEPRKGKAAVKHIADAHHPMAKAQWILRNHPDVLEGIAGPGIQGAEIARKVRVEEMSEFRIDDWLKAMRGDNVKHVMDAEYNRYKRDLQEDYADALYDAADQKFINEKELKEATNKAEFSGNKRFDARVNERDEKRNAGKPQTGTSGNTFDATQDAQGHVGKAQIQFGAVPEMSLLSPDLQKFLQAGDQQRLFGKVEEGEVSFLDDYKLQMGGTGTYQDNRTAYSSAEAEAKKGGIQRPGAARMLGGVRGQGANQYAGSKYDNMQREEAIRRKAMGTGIPGAASIAKVNTYLSTLSKPELTRLQQHLAMTGIMSDEAISNNTILWGYAGDEETIKAWAQVAAEASALNKSMSDVIMERATLYAPRMAAILAGTTGPGQDIEVHLSDPDTIRKAADDSFVTLLGRLPTEGERNILINSIRNAEGAVGQQRLAALRSRSRVKLGPDGKPLPIGMPDKEELDALLGVPVMGPMGEVMTGQTLVMPVPGGKYGNDWGQGRSGGRSHQGTDIFAPIGTPVLAAKDGVIKKTGSGGVQGHMLSLSVSGVDSKNYFYNHLDPNKLIVGVGQRVSAGQVIGYVGDAPRLIGTGSHLHFSINEGTSRAENPFNYLNRAQKISAAPLAFGPDTASGAEAAKAAEDRLLQIEDVDPGASVEEWAKRERPVEYGAQKLGQSYEVLTKMFRGE